MNEQLTVNIPDLLVALRTAHDRMGAKNSHRGLMFTAFQVIALLLKENAQLQAAAAATPEPSPLVSLA